MQEFDNLKKKTIFGMIWSFAEQIGAQLVSFVVSIILARLLMPEEYGIIAMVWVFINLGNVFVNSGFGRALIQKKDADDLDFSSVFWFSLAMSLLLYALLFAAAPWIAGYYRMEKLEPVLRVMGLRLVIASFNTVQRANVSKKLQYKKFFFSTLGATICSAAIGITMAWLGFGVWALVAQELTNVLFGTIILLVTMDWHPQLKFSLTRMKGLFHYGWKVLVSGLIDTAYEEMRSMYVGKLYSAEDLAHYSRGKQLPYLLVDNIHSSIASVMFSALSTVQDDPETVKNMARRMMKTSAYVLTPALIGLAAVSEPLVLLLFTEKWLPSVPLMQIMCINCALTPLHAVNFQIISAMGRSDIALKTNVIVKALGFVVILIFARISVEAMAWSVVVMSVISLCANSIPNKRLVNYGFWEQLWDIGPNWILAAAMFALVRAVTLLHLPLFAELVVMVLVGVVSYIGLSILFRVESFQYLWNILRPYLSRLKKR